MREPHTHAWSKRRRQLVKPCHDGLGYFPKIQAHGQRAQLFTGKTVYIKQPPTTPPCLQVLYTLHVSTAGQTHSVSAMIGLVVYSRFSGCLAFALWFEWSCSGFLGLWLPFSLCFLMLADHILPSLHIRRKTKISYKVLSIPIQVSNSIHSSAPVSTHDTANRCFPLICSNSLHVRVICTVFVSRLRLARYLAP